MSPGQETDQVCSIAPGVCTGATTAGVDLAMFFHMTTRGRTGHNRNIYTTASTHQKNNKN